MSNQIPESGNNCIFANFHVNLWENCLPTGKFLLPGTIRLMELLTHWGWVTHICVSKPYHHWIRQWLVAWTVPSRYLNQCWYIVNWILRKKFQRKLKISNIFIQENAFENAVCEMAFFSSRSQWVNTQTSTKWPTFYRVKSWQFCPVPVLYGPELSCKSPEIGLPGYG